MTLEIFKANFHSINIGSINVGMQIGVILNNKLYLEHLTFNNDKMNEILSEFNQTHCSLLSYRKFEINRQPKNLKWFLWLIFHNSGYFLSTIRNEKDATDKVEKFLDFE